VLRCIPVVESACFHASSPPRTSSTCLRVNFVRDVIYSMYAIRDERAGEKKKKEY
jgi:hypothetical protein